MNFYNVYRKYFMTLEILKYNIRVSIAIHKKGYTIAEIILVTVKENNALHNCTSYFKCLLLFWH